MRLFVRLDPPYEWVRVTDHQVVAFGEVARIEDYPLPDDEVIGVVDGKFVTSHSVNLPAKSRKLFASALPYALEESVSQDIDDLHFVFSDWSAGKDCVVHSVGRDKMREWQNLATEHQLPIQQLVPDTVLVPYHEAADYSLACSSDKDKEIKVHHVSGRSIELEEKFLDLWLSEVKAEAVISVNDEELTQKLIADNPKRDFRYWSFGHKMAHWLEYPFKSSLNLWGDDFKPNIRLQGSKEYLLPVMVLLAAVLIKFSYDTYRYFSLHSEIRSVNAQMQEIFQQAMPDFSGATDGNERVLMERALSRSSGGTHQASLNFALSITAGMMQAEGVTLSELNYREGELIISCVLRDLSQVDRLASRFSSHPRLNAQVQSSENDKGRILASYRITQS